MSWIAFILIVLSAGMHASWNTIAKKTRMSLVFYAIICSVSAALWLHTQIWTPVNVFHLPGRFWLILLAAVISDGALYCLGLIMAFKYMEMSVAYPIMRSLPILFIAVLTACFGWGEPLGPVAGCGMVVAFAGCLLMPLKKFSDFSLRKYLNWNMFFVLMVALGTTGYTLFDSQAQSVLREAVPGVSKPVLSMTYYSTRGICLSSFLWIMVVLSPSDRKSIRSYRNEHGLMPLWAGLLASLTYITVLIAMNYVSNVSYVQVFRQLGLVFGLLESILILKERCTATKVAGVVLILTGLTLTVIR